MAEKTTEGPEVKTPKFTLSDFTARYGQKTATPPPQGVSQGGAAPDIFHFMASAKGPEAPPKPSPEAPFTEPVEPDPQIGGSSGTYGYGDPSKTSILQAKIINKLTEVGLSQTAKSIAMADSAKMFRPDEEMSEDLIYLWAVVIEDSDKKIPPGALLAITLVVIWGPIFVQAFNVRKLNKERQPMARPRNTGRATQAKPEPANDGPGTISDVEEVEAEKDFSEIQDELILRLDDSNKRADMAGIARFATYHQPPQGCCKWYYMVEGREVALTKPGNTFFSAKEAMRWTNLKKDYKHCQIDFPGDWTA